jgi:tRNA pseudouridine65 synthase
MTGLFTGGEVSKAYLAVVRGYVEEAGRIDHPLKERRADRRADADKPSQQAVTEYAALGTVELPQPIGPYETARFSFVHVTPLTGRNHQIRKHMKHIFHPVVGDTTYGDGKQNDFFRKQLNCHRLLLHARSIRFKHPYTDEPVHIEAPLDQTFNTVLDRLHWEQVVLP